jgi:hypothetical protein
MRTTLINPTVWLLAGTAVAAIAGVLRQRDARQSFDVMVRYACTWPLLVVLVAMAAAGAGSRAALGLLAPGAYAEEVIAARSFLEERQLYDADPRQELEQWTSESTLAAPPWADLPGISPCQASTLTDRARFFTNHAHTPMLLLAGVPIVKAGGGRGLYAVLLLLSLLGVLAIVAVLLERTGISWRSRPALLLLAAVGGWQPVLAGIRQGDAVLPVTALGVLAWHLAGRRERAGSASLAAGLAACFALPAIGLLPAMLRSWARPGLLSVVVFAAGVAATMLVAGAGVIPSFVQIAVNTASTYAYAVTNYAVFARAGAAGMSPAVVTGLIMLVVLVTWMRARSADDSFASYSVLGLLLAPVVWSQHLALLLVPVVVLLGRVLVKRSSLSLAGWAGLMLLFSLPDASAAWFSEVLPIRVPGAVLPVLSIGLLVTWGWLVGAAGRRPSASAVPDVIAAAPLI